MSFGLTAFAASELRTRQPAQPDPASVTEARSTSAPQADIS
jgi:hypothetical protein